MSCFQGLHLKSLFFCKLLQDINKKGFGRRRQKMKRSCRGLIYQTLIIIILISLLVQLYGLSRKKSEVLFPGREYVKKQSEVFFKKVDTKHPSITKVDFFTRSEAYLSAYLNLTIYVIKNNYLKEKLLLFEKENLPYIEKFNQYKQKLKIENYLGVRDELKVTHLKFYLLVLYTLFNDYQNNKLSGNNAFILWNILLAITESTYKSRNKTAENAAILEISSHFVFFKKHKKWQKKAKKMLRKIDLKSAADKDVQAVFTGVMR
jgi:hypothetical protein